MKTILKEFLKDKVNIKALNEEFNYEFTKTSTKQSFDREFNIFLRYHSSVFYFKNRLVTIYNSYEIKLKTKDLTQIFKLYNYASKKNLKYESLILIEFLFTYYRTINTKEYKKNINGYRDFINKFNEVLDSFNLTIKFHNDVIFEIYSFYEELIKFAINENLYIGYEFIERIFNNSKNQVVYNNLIDFLLSYNKHISIVIKYDVEISKHKNVYLNYINKSLDKFGGYEYINFVLGKLISNRSISNEDVKKIINKYIDIVNNITNKTREKNYNFIQGIAEFDHLLSELIILMDNVSKLSIKFKNKVKEMITLLLSVKRYLTSDEEFCKSSLHTFEYKQSLQSKEIHELKETLIKNVTTLYGISKIKFSKSVGNALENYSEFPFASVGVSFHINSDNGTYIKDLGVLKNNNNFKDYYDKIGYDYTEQNKKLRNKLEKNYYEELLKYSRSIFIYTQNMIRGILTKDEFDLIIENLKQNISCDYNNVYAIVITNIIAIEFNIIKVLQKKSQEIFDYGYDNLNSLFNQYEDPEHKDGLMYINYILYEQSGLNLRNDMVHGNNLNQNLDVALITTFAALIYINGLLNEQ